MSEKKKTTTLYLREDLIQQAKIAGLNVSQLAEQAIASAIDGAPFKDEEVYLSHLINRRLHLMERSRVINSQKEYLDVTLTDVEKRIDYQRKLVKEIHESQRIASLIGEINKLIVAYQYEFTVIKFHTTNMVKLLNDLRPGYFTDEWLQDQITRMQRM